MALREKDPESIRGYLTDREVTRSYVAHYWGKAPWELRRISLRDYKVAVEARDRLIEAENDMYERVKRGEPAKSRAKRR